ncbi:FxsA family protein [Bathymodiolus septemdierum thioautotrophic gill symbiont]|uniref:FxsA protein n=1 Tax=endosymbiont of Bathymodiolus septemdierum str. Myojin knoll TaxID=1303921 RepID=A0A0P0UPQ8_9GAMM|nr:FxsA family protein [Bathymodiolus septemdierum thioautotrophic gill symbiont]BAS67169.1 FxsA protein [endosymbiont of Bathymodiolus septemdierum str. Myojin knoll]
MLLLIFVISTTLELMVLIEVGGAIGTGNTILLIILTAFIGAYLLKQQGLSTLQKVQQMQIQGQNPSFEMLQGVVIMVSGILLLTPGFITDSVGLLGLMPWSRAFFLRYFLEKNVNRIFTSTQTQQQKQKNRQDDKIVEGEFWEE